MQINLNMKQKRNQGHREQTGGYQGEGGGGGQEWVSEISRCKLVYTERINNESHCIEQGTTFNILWQTIMEKSMKKNICMTESLYCTEIYTALQINYTWIKLKKKRLNGLDTSLK